MAKRPSKIANGNTAADRELAATLCRWFRGAARELPWRAVGEDGKRNPYWSLVSELMLQQTQVSRVLPKFVVFIERFPTVGALAAAQEEDVLAAWSGLGYYRRARMLHMCVKEIVRVHGGSVPRGVDELRELPGIGRYTAGAVASMAFGDRAAVVDGNVVRVLLRVRGKPMRAGEKETEAWAWGEAERLVGAIARERDVGVFNEALMELGATVCTPAAPKCLECPVRGECAARRLGKQGEIPMPKRAAGQKRLVHACLIVEDARGRVLMERRAAKGLWGGMWQPLTVEGWTAGGATEPGAGWEHVRASVGVRGKVQHMGAFERKLTHRLVRFEVFYARAVAQRVTRAGMVWVARRDVFELALSNAHRHVLEIGLCVV